MAGKNIAINVESVGRSLCLLSAVGHVCSLGGLIASIFKIILLIKVLLHTFIGYFYNHELYKEASSR